MHVVMTRVIEEAQFAQDAAGGAGVELQADFLTAIPVVQREKALCLNFICQQMEHGYAVDKVLWLTWGADISFTDG